FRGQPIGYDYELVKAFAESQGLDLEVRVIDDLNQMFELLRSGEGDLIACNLVINEERQQIVEFTNPLGETKQVLVQKKPDSWWKMSAQSLDDTLIRNIHQLADKKINVHQYSSFWARLYEINNQEDIQIDIQPAKGDVDSEELIQKVVSGEITFTVADENVARLNQTYEPSLDVETAISEPQDIAWAVRQNSDSLLLALNDWISDKKNKRKLAFTYSKYFKSVKDQKQRVSSEYSSLGGNRISAYDEIIQAESERLDWDWRLLAAIIYSESRFNPEAKSWAGAFGLMQIMPITGARFGIDTSMTEKANIQAGVSFLKYLEKFWAHRVDDPDERRRFILASYNAGHGHVLDAQRLAIELGLNPQVWTDNVEQSLKYKSHAKYYRMTCVQHGYCRGESATDYVKNVMNHFQHYVSLTL
ncbi:MAG: membrane-bound lytic murein transglycosylase F, partial [Litorivivens sp.]